MASSPAPSTIGARFGSILVSVAAALVILGVSIVPFFTPAWIHGEQDRAGSAAFLGADLSTVNGYSDQIVHDLLLGGDFVVPVVDKACFGKTGACGSLLDAREQSHMRDVRGVFQALAGLVLLGGVALILTGWRSRTSGVRRSAWWRAVSSGGAALAVLMVGVGILSIIAFDAAFQVFHELLFPAGSFSFDPATEHLVQLYPDQFWSDTTLALGALAVALSGLVAWAGRRMARRSEGASIERSTASAGATPLSPRSVP